MDTPPPPTPSPAGETAPGHNPLIPQDQDKKAGLAVFMADAWATNPQLTFIWTTQAECKTKALAFDAAVKARNKAAALRPQQTLSFAQYDEQIKEALDDVKGYISEAYGKQAAKSYYAEFGIEARGDNYELPRAQKERADALDMLVDALTTHGFQDRKYGVTYWDPIATGYATLTGNARKAASALSGLVGDKNTEEAYVDDVLSAMLSLLDAQYRNEEERAAKRRELGYQREYN